MAGADMRILNLMLGEGRGGLENMALRYHEALSAEGFDVLSLGHPKGLLIEKLPANQTQSLTSAFTHDPFAALKLKGQAARFKPDLILAHGNRAISLCGHGLAGLGPKTVAVVHNFRFKRDIVKLKAAIGVSEPVCDALKAVHPALPVHIMENFTPLVMHPVKPFASETPMLGTLGRLHVNKGLDLMIQAAGLLRDRGVSVHLRLAGDGPEKETLLKLVQTLGLSDQVRFDGWIEPADGFLAALDLFVLPSRVEPFGLVVAEAMAAGVPVIASRLDGPRHILKDGELGGMTAPESAESLAEAISTALNDWAEVLERAHNAQAHALETYGVLAGRTRLKRLILEIAG